MSIPKWHLTSPSRRKSSSSRLTFTIPYASIIVLVILLLRGFSVSTYTIREIQLPFSVTLTEAPVLNRTGKLRFANTPVSSLRPSNQYVRLSSPSSFLRHLGIEFAQPSILSVITVTRNARPVFRETAKFMMDQSLVPIRWIIINEHSTQKESYQMLQDIASQDSRFILINSTAPQGFSHGRMQGLSYLRKNPTDYFAFLDDDDLWELTAYEKCVWMLESNRNISMCGTFVVGFGDKNYTWEHGFHSGMRTLLNNPLTGSEILRTSVLEKTGCQFDLNLNSGMEDWEFYLCIANQGHWGGTIPEFLFWYRQNPIALRKQRWKSLFDNQTKTADTIRSRYKLLQDKFPEMRISPSTAFEKFEVEPPFSNDLGLNNGILFIIPWMAIGGGDTANLQFVKEFSKRGYRVTIVCTLLNLHDDSMASKSFFMQYTHDVFVLPAIIRVVDIPRFMSYIMKSRGISRVFLSNSQMGYGLLPWLSARYPDVVFIDYVHNEEPTWKNGGYAAFSTIHQSSIDATFTSSETTRKFMINKGRNPATVHVGYLGIDLKDLRPLQSEEKAVYRKKFGIPQDATVAIYLARMIPHKQPKVALQSFLQLVRTQQAKSGEEGRLARKFKLIMIGNGYLLPEVQRIAEQNKQNVMVFGSMDHAKALEYLAISDVFCLPSTSEGLSFALAESMALGVTALTSNIGGASELLIDNGKYGIMVETTGDSEKDKVAFTREMQKLFEQTKWRREMGKRASKRVRKMFDASKHIPSLVTQFLEMKVRRIRYPNGDLGMSTVYYAQSSVLRDLGVFSDFPEIHNTMQGKIRSAYGNRYRATCGEYNEVITKLIDILENPSACDPKKKINIEKLRTSAITQCGRWCVIDKDDKKLRKGWNIREQCGVEEFNDSEHHCIKWYKNLSSEYK